MSMTALNGDSSSFRQSDAEATFRLHPTEIASTAHNIYPVEMLKYPNGTAAWVYSTGRTRLRYNSQLRDGKLRCAIYADRLDQRIDAIAFPALEADLVALRDDLATRVINNIVPATRTTMTVGPVGNHYDVNLRHKMFRIKWPRKPDENRLLTFFLLTREIRQAMNSLMQRPFVPLSLADRLADGAVPDDSPAVD
jgi:hypothetical protein